MTYVMGSAPKQSIAGSAVDAPAVAETSQELVFRLLGNSMPIATFFHNNATLFEQFATLVRSNDLQAGPKREVELLFGKFRGCFEEGEDKNGPLAKNRSLNILFNDAMITALRNRWTDLVKELGAQGVRCGNSFEVTQQARKLMKSGDTELLRALAMHGCFKPKELSQFLFEVPGTPSTHKARMLEILLDHGAVIDQTLGRGKTALSYAAERNDLLTVEFLLSRGANPDGQREFAISPLRHAINHNNMEMALLLDTAGASRARADVTAHEQALLDQVYHAYLARPQSPV
jgi:hypothetical protein